MENITITQVEMDRILKAENGWMRFQHGHELVYDYHMQGVPVIIKVASTVSVDGKTDCRNREIRVWSVMKGTSGEIVRGLTKSRRVHRVDGWEDRLKDAVLRTMSNVSSIYLRKCEM